MRIVPVDHVKPLFVDFDEKTSTDGTVTPVALFPMGRVIEYSVSKRLSHQIAKSTPASTEMSGKT